MVSLGGKQDGCRQRSRFEPWRGNYKRDNQLGWLVLVFQGATPPTSPRTFWIARIWLTLPRGATRELASPSPQAAQVDTGAMMADSSLTRPSVMFFHSHGARYSRLATRLLNPRTEVGYVFYAENLETFLEITKNSADLWDLIVVEESLAGFASEALADIQSKKPDVLVAIESEQLTSGRAGAANSTTFVKPPDNESWVMTIRSLLSTCRSQ